MTSLTNVHSLLTRQVYFTDLIIFNYLTII